MLSNSLPFLSHLQHAAILIITTYVVRNHFIQFFKFLVIAYLSSNIEKMNVVIARISFALLLCCSPEEYSLVVDVHRERYSISIIQFNGLLHITHTHNG